MAKGCPGNRVASALPPVVAQTQIRQAARILLIHWENLPTEELLDVRLSELGLEVANTWLEDCVDKLREELDGAGLRRFRLHTWLSDEWCSPDGVPGVGIPFYLAHPRLMRLERQMMFEVEGGTRTECMRLLRHEAGHALQHAYNLQRRKLWQRAFGRASEPYPDFYRPNPSSKGFVEHLDGWYAQAHPVEDFAETFAVWLAPRSNWQEQYAHSAALTKLEYIDDLVAELGSKKPQVSSRARPYSLSRLHYTLRRHYERRQDHYSPGFSDEYDRDLSKIFSNSPRYRNNETAASFLRRNRRQIREQISVFTGEYQFTVDQVLRDIIGRCRELRLRLTKGERQTNLDFAIMLTVHTVHLLHRRDTWHPL